MKNIKNIKNILMLVGSVLLISACEDLVQVPSNQILAGVVTDFEPALFAAYGYHYDAAARMAVFGDFRSDNALFDEAPFTNFDKFGTNALTSSMTNDFFEPFYKTLYQSILSANSVIDNTDDATLVGEAKFVRALSYFKLVQVFGDVSVNLAGTFTVEDIATADRLRQPKNDVYNNVIIPDLKAAMSALDPSSAADADGRATSIAAQGLLGKVYATMGNYSDAATELRAVIDTANGDSSIYLQKDFAEIFGGDNDLNSEILFATQMSSSASISSSNGELFTVWYAGGNTKADDGAPMSQDLIDAFAASAGDLRTALTLDGTTSVKYASGTTTDADWIELRLTDVVMLYAEALNENDDSDAAREEALDMLDPIRSRAGLSALDHNTLNTQALVRQAILDERRLEFACEGQRWFDLRRFDAASPGILNAEMGETISSEYHIFPIPNTEVTSFDEIKQNPGY